MCCDNTIRMMNDFLDKTLSENEEREIKRHLAACETCRNEYNNLEKADIALRQVICEMVADIEVPGGLSDRIEKAVSAGNRKKTMWSRLSVMLRTPAAAAAMLFVILAAGILTFNNYFIQHMAANQQKVAVSGEVSNYTDGTGINRSAQENEAIAEKTGSEKEVRVLQADSDQAGNPVQQLNEVPQNTVRGAVADQPESGPVILPGQTPAPLAATAPEALSKSVPAERNIMVTSAPPGMGESTPASDSGAMEDTADAGFIPAKPFYLPQGAELTDVSWSAGESTQSYRAGKYYFKVSQSRLEVGEPEYDASFSEGSAVDINGHQGFIQESRAETVDNASGAVTTLRWRQGEWAFSVTGDLPAEEIIKVARSIK